MKRLDRREWLKWIPLGCLGCALDGSKLLRPGNGSWESNSDRRFDAAALGSLDPIRDEGAAGHGGHLHKIHDFDRTYDDDVFVAAERIPVLESAAARLERAQRVIGHGNFNLTSFDQLLRFAARYSDIGEFPRSELELLDEVFYTDAAEYGFFGEKVLTEQTAVIPHSRVEKIPHTGHYLLRGEPLQKYRRIRRDLGDRVFLTSGVRAIAKQYQLFLSKAVETAGNLSQASRSLAPPGYSFHAVGDFDLGRVGYGLKNFTAEFADTPEYRKLIDLGYVDIRYTDTNPFGVRHEPWHIKIA